MMLVFTTDNVCDGCEDSTTVINEGRCVTVVPHHKNQPFVAGEVYGK